MTEALYLFVFMIVFFLVVLILRSYLLWKNTEINPITFDRTDDAHGFNGKIFGMVLILKVIVVFLQTFGGHWNQYLVSFWYLEHSILNGIGWFFLHIAFAWIFIAQLQMADAWRIGIDPQHETDLVTQGLFSISRNPIFLGMLIASLGLFLVLPNAFTLLIAALSFTSIHTQVRLEEAFLQGRHGTTYLSYCQAVRRWI